MGKLTKKEMRNKYQWLIDGLIEEVIETVAEDAHTEDDNSTIQEFVLQEVILGLNGRIKSLRK